MKNGNGQQARGVVVGVSAMHVASCCFVLFFPSQQCGPATKVSYYPNDLLDQLVAKYVYRKQALSSLKMMDPTLSPTAKR